MASSEEAGSAIKCYLETLKVSAASNKGPLTGVPASNKGPPAR